MDGRFDERRKEKGYFFHTWGTYLINNTFRRRVVVERLKKKGNEE